MLCNITILSDNLYPALAAYNYNLEQLVPSLQDKRHEIVHMVRNLIKQQGPAFIHDMPLRGEIIKENFKYSDLNITTIRTMLRKTRVLWDQFIENYPVHK